MEGLSLDAHSRFLLDVRTLSRAGEEKRALHCCEYLIVANGHYSAPYVPRLPGLASEFAGAHLHMHHLRDLATDLRFPGQRVLVVGYRFGGMDLVQNLLFEFPRHFGSLHVSTESSFHLGSQDLAPFLERGVLAFHPRLRAVVGPHAV